jgi:hypothetical protein
MVVHCGFREYPPERERKLYGVGKEQRTTVSLQGGRPVVAYNIRSYLVFRLGVWQPMINDSRFSQGSATPLGLRLRILKQ